MSSSGGAFLSSSGGAPTSSGASSSAGGVGVVGSGGGGTEGVPLRPIVPDFHKKEIDSGFHNFAVTVGEFTGDGELDIIVAGGETDIVYLYVAPTFERVTLSELSSAIHVVTMDVDADGDDDAVFCRHSPGLIFWLEQPGSGQLTEPWSAHMIDGASLSGADGIHGLAVSDVNGDGRDDLVASAGFQSSVYVYFVPTDPTMPWPRETIADGDAPALTHYVAAGDLNGDGRIDVATGGKQGNFFAWWEQPQEPGDPWLRHYLTSETGATHVEIMDLNGDGVFDILASRGHGDGLLWYEGPEFEVHPLDDTMHWPHAMAAGDIDNDGDIDVVAAGATDGKGVAWFENDGQGSFTKHSLDENQRSYQSTLLDLDADGDLDIVLSGVQSENVVIFENRGI